MKGASEHGSSVPDGSDPEARILGRTVTDVVIREVGESDLHEVHRLIISTIDACYTAHYPPRAVDFFRQHHSVERIAERRRNGVVLVATKDDAIVATGSLVDDEIAGMFVDPLMQGRGIGAAIVMALEREATAAGRRRVRLDVSVTARGFYERLGYTLAQADSIDVGGGQSLNYWNGWKPIFELRPATVGDFDAMVSIWLAASERAHAFVAPSVWRSQAREMRDRYLPSAESYVAVSAGELAGFVCLVGNEVAALFVDPDHQSAGIGSCLLAHSQSLRARLTLHVFAANKVAIAFYERHGFSRGVCRIEPLTRAVEFEMQWARQAG